MIRQTMVTLLLATMIGGCGDASSGNKADPPKGRVAASDGAQASIQRVASWLDEAPEVSAEVPRTTLRAGAANRVRIGEVFAVGLSEHPSVGSTWELVEGKGPIRTLQPIHKYAREGPIPPGGDSRITYFRFSGTAKGPATLRFRSLFRGTAQSEEIYRVVIE